MDWFDLAGDRQVWWVPVDAVMNLQVPQSAGTCLSRCQLPVCQVQPSSMQLQIQLPSNVSANV
jgi:hypothetical protein